MINLSNETDYKLIFKTKNLYNFFFVLIIILFVGVFFKIINLSVQENNNQIESVMDREDRRRRRKNEDKNDDDSGSGHLHMNRKNRKNGKNA